MKQFEQSGYLHLNAQEKTALHHILSILIDTAKPSQKPNGYVECINGGTLQIDAIGYAAINTLILKLENNG